MDACLDEESLTESLIVNENETYANLQELIDKYKTTIFTRPFTVAHQSEWLAIISLLRCLHLSHHLLLSFFQLSCISKTPAVVSSSSFVRGSLARTASAEEKPPTESDGAQVTPFEVLSPSLSP